MLPDMDLECVLGDCNWDYNDIDMSVGIWHGKWVLELAALKNTFFSWNGLWNYIYLQTPEWMLTKNYHYLSAFKWVDEIIFSCSSDLAGN